MVYCRIFSLAAAGPVGFSIKKTSPMSDLSPTLKSFLQRWAINTLGVLVAANIVPGINYDSYGGLFVTSLLLGILNALIRPLLLLLSLPLIIFSLGLFILIINAFLLYFVDLLVKPFHVNGFGAAFWGGLIISLVSLVANSLTGTGSSRVKFHRRMNSAPPPPVQPPRRKDGDGPVIDI